VSSRPSLAAFGALAALSAAGCFPPEDPNDPIERAKRDAAAAERGIIRRRRDRTWFLVKYWARAAPRDEPRGEQRRRKSEVPAHGRKALEWKPVPPPRGPHGSILLGPGQSGFVAVARGEPVPRFDLDGKSYGADGGRVDRGFDITVHKVEAGLVTATMTPVFRGLAEGGGDLRLETLTDQIALGPGAAEALLIEAPPDADDPVTRAFWFDVPEEGKRPTRRRLYVQVEAFR